MSETAIPHIADEAWSLDVDRTLVRTGEAVVVLQEAYDAEKAAGDLPDLNLVDIQGGVEETGTSFSPFGVIREITKKNVMIFNKICDTFVEIGRSSERLVYNDTRPFLRYLNTHDKLHYLNTKAVDFEWQRYKILAADLGAIPCAMTTESDKDIQLFRSRVITQSGETYFAPQTLLLRGQHYDLAARTVMGVDDYKECLMNWPGQAYWLDRPEARNSKKQRLQADIVLPENVTRITTLMDLIK